MSWLSQVDESATEGNGSTLMLPVVRAAAISLLVSEIVPSLDWQIKVCICILSTKSVAIMVT